MKLKFKTQVYQTAAVQSVVECFKGQVCLLQQLQCIKIVAFDEQVLRGIEVHAFCPHWAQGLGNRGIGCEHGLSLSWPV